MRTDATYPAGFMDVIEIEKTGEQFRLVYDVKGRFVVHRISPEEASYKLAKVGRRRTCLRPADSQCATRCKPLVCDTLGLVAPSPRQHCCS